MLAEALTATDVGNTFFYGVFAIFHYRYSLPAKRWPQEKAITAMDFITGRK